ncbi:Uncharacterized protein At3g61260 [Linum grandiflorum]
MAEQVMMEKMEAQPPLAEYPMTTPVPPPSAVEENTNFAAAPPPEEAAKPVESELPPTAAPAEEEKPLELAPKKISGGSHDRDVALAQLDKEKKSSFIKAWEDSEKSKVINKAQKQLSAVAAWENSKKAAAEAKLKKIEQEQLEKKKAGYAEKMKNQVAQIHKEAEEKRAMVEAKRGEEILKTEEMAAKYRATGHIPKKLLGCF